NFLEMTYKVRKALRQLEQQKKDTVSIEEIEEETGFSRQDIEDALAVEDWHVSLDTSVNEEGDSLHEVIEDEGAEPSDSRALRREELDKISSALKHLSDREAEIIRLHYGLEGERPHTFAEAAEKMSVSHQRVKKLEKSAFSKLRDKVTATAHI
ncbi:MAG: sigma-70 family RNA polymerase sigma factor, partial [Chitinispirillaceae bacterium]